MVSVSTEGAGAAFVSQEDRTASRALETSYQNTNTLTMMVAVSADYGTIDSDLIVYSDSSNPPTTEVGKASLDEAGCIVTLTFMVLPGNYYKVSCANGSLRKLIEWV